MKNYCDFQNFTKLFFVAFIDIMAKHYESSNGIFVGKTFKKRFHWHLFRHTVKNDEIYQKLLQNRQCLENCISKSTTAVRKQKCTNQFPLFAFLANFSFWFKPSCFLKPRNSIIPTNYVFWCVRIIFSKYIPFLKQLKRFCTSR